MILAISNPQAPDPVTAKIWICSAPVVNNDDYVEGMLERHFTAGQCNESQVQTSEVVTTPFAASYFGFNVDRETGKCRLLP